jgi:3-oxoacyl-[acyl-carrier protein] reductase
MVAAVHKHFGRIDVLVNNAGASPFGSFDHVSLEDWTSAYQLKFFGFVEAARQVVPLMRAQGGGSIINIAGNGGRQVSPQHLIGGSINAAIIHFTRALALGFGPFQIRTNCVSPGPIATERMEALFASIAKEREISIDEAKMSIASEIPLGRLGPIMRRRHIRFVDLITIAVGRTRQLFDRNLMKALQRRRGIQQLITLHHHPHPAPL